MLETGAVDAIANKLLSSPSRAGRLFDRVPVSSTSRMRFNTVRPRQSQKGFDASFAEEEVVLVLVDDFETVPQIES